MCQPYIESDIYTSLLDNVYNSSQQIFHATFSFIFYLASFFTSFSITFSTPILLFLLCLCHPVAPPHAPTGVRVTNIQPHSVVVSWDAQSNVNSYTVQYTNTHGASQLEACMSSIHSNSVTTTGASTSITVQGSGDAALRAFTTYSITVTAVSATSFLGSSAPSVAVLVTTTQTGII